MSSSDRSSLSDAGTGESFQDISDLADEVAEEKEKESSGTQSTSGGSETTRMTFHITEDLAERLRDAVFHTPGDITLSGTARDALRAAVRQIEKEHNDGDRFPPRDGQLQGGRPKG
jgi:hypothetical protein